MGWELELEVERDTVCVFHQFIEVGAFIGVTSFHPLVVHGFSMLSAIEDMVIREFSETYTHCSSFVEAVRQKRGRTQAPKKRGD